MVAPARWALLAVCLVAPTAASHSRDWIKRYNPVANPSSIVTHGNARFTVLTAGTVRMEVEDSQEWNDEASITMLHRDLPTPPFTNVVKGSTVTITTKNFKLTYDSDPSKGPGFTPNNLRVELLVKPFSVWVPGADASGNMHGTIRTLDRVGHAVDLKCPPMTSQMVYYTHCEEGFASKDGWVVVDDSLRPRFDLESNEDWVWMKKAPDTALRMVPHGTGGQIVPQRFSYSDLYFFGNGLNHTANLGDYVKLSGPIPLLPRYTLGPQFSRWYPYGEIDSMSNVLSGFGQHGVPLDVYVVDMDWHYTYDRGLPNAYGVKVEGWTGYTLYPFLYPTGKHFMEYLKRRGVRTTFNIHPAAGVQFHEANYAAMAADMGINPASGASIEFNGSDINYHRALFKNMLKPIDDMGLAFYWIDWQQGPFTAVPFLNPTFALNYAYSTNPYRYGQYNAEHGRDRPYVMGRWGGLGGHRHPIGFVGDTYSKWNVLKYEFYFMSTASNVAFAWTHDIGGFAGRPEPEMFTRWVQFGVFSPILRTHSHKTSPARMISQQNNPHFSIMRHFYRLRARLVPYISTAQRIAYDTGVQVVRPMYYAHADTPAAYEDTALHQFYFGPDIWTAPIAAPAPNSTFFGSMVNHTFWVPPGKWVEWYSFEAVTAPPAGAYFARNYSISETPVFSPPGAIITMRNLPKGEGVLGTASAVPEDLIITVFPGVSLPAGPKSSVTTRARIYDDDGMSVDYQDGAFSWTDVSCTWTKAAVEASGSDTLGCTVHAPSSNGFAGFPAKRKWGFRFPGTWAPATVTIDGETLLHDPYGYPDPNGEEDRWVPGVNVWSYDGATLSTWVRLETPVATDTSFTVILTFPAGASSEDPLLTSGFARKVSRCLTCKTAFDAAYGIVFPSDSEHLLNVTASVTRLAASVNNHALSARLLGAVKKQLKKGVSVMEGWKIPATHTFMSSSNRCLGAILDALTPFTEVSAPEPFLHNSRAYADVMQTEEPGYYTTPDGQVAEG